MNSSSTVLAIAPSNRNWRRPITSNLSDVTQIGHSTIINPWPPSAPPAKNEQRLSRSAKRSRFRRSRPRHRSETRWPSADAGAKRRRWFSREKRCCCAGAEKRFTMFDGFSRQNVVISFFSYLETTGVTCIKLSGFFNIPFFWLLNSYLISPSGKHSE